MPIPDTTLARRASNTAPSVYARPRFVSASGRTLSFIDAAGMQDLAEENELMRDRVVLLQIEADRLRRLLTAGSPSTVCAERDAD